MLPKMTISGAPNNKKGKFQKPIQKEMPNMNIENIGTSDVICKRDC